MAMHPAIPEAIGTPPGIPSALGHDVVTFAVWSTLA